MKCFEASWGGYFAVSGLSGQSGAHCNAAQRVRERNHVGHGVLAGGVVVRAAQVDSSSPVGAQIVGGVAV